MRIRLDLSGELDDALPSAVAAGYAVADDATVADVVDSLPFSARVALTAVNGELVAPAERAGRRLSEGDELTLLPPIKGG